MEGQYYHRRLKSCYRYEDNCFSCNKEKGPSIIILLNHVPGESANLAISCPHLKNGAGYMMFKILGEQLRRAEEGGLEGKLTVTSIREVLRKNPPHFSRSKSIFSDGK